MKVLLLLLLLIEIVTAQSIGVSPGYIEIYGKQGDTVKNNFIILNPSDEQIYFEIISDNKFNIKPSQGNIPVGESREITLTTILDSDYETKILIKIIANGNKESVSINAGILLKIRIYVEKEIEEDRTVKNNKGIIIIVSILGIGLFSYHKFKKKIKNHAS